MSPAPRKAASFSMEIPDLDRKIKMWKALAPQAFDRGLEAGIRASTIEVQSEVKKLIDGPVLNRRTGRLWRSIHPEVYRRAGTIVGIVGTDVEYAAIHEFGGTIRPKNKSGYLVYEGEEGWVMTRQVKMPKRPFMSKAFHAKRRRIGELVESHVIRSLKGTLKTGRVMKVSKRTGVGYDAD